MSRAPRKPFFRRGTRKLLQEQNELLETILGRLDTLTLAAQLREFRWMRDHPGEEVTLEENSEQ